MFLVPVSCLCLIPAEFPLLHLSFIPVSLTPANSYPVSYDFRIYISNSPLSPYLQSWILCGFSAFSALVCQTSSSLPPLLKSDLNPLLCLLAQFSHPKEFFRRSMSTTALSQPLAATASSCSSISSLNTRAPPSALRAVTGCHNLEHDFISPLLLYFLHPSQLFLLFTCSTSGTICKPGA